MADGEFVPLGVAVMTISDTRSLETDGSGATIVEALQAKGHIVRERQIIKDEIPEISATLKSWIEQRDVDVIITTGGTGITARDVTPEALAPLVTKEIPGFGELFRWLSYEDIGPATVQSRAQAALCGETIVFALPGSSSAVRLAMSKIILPQLDRRTKPCNFAQLLPRFRS